MPDPSPQTPPESGTHSRGELAARLRDMGYLEGRVDRFLIDATRRGPLQLSVRLAALLALPWCLLILATHVVADPLLLTDWSRSLLGAAAVWVSLLTVFAALVRVFLWRPRVYLRFMSVLVLLLYGGLSWWHVRSTLSEGELRYTGDGLALLLFGCAAFAFGQLLARVGRIARGESRSPSRVVRRVYLAVALLVAGVWGACFPRYSEIVAADFTPQATGQRVLWVQFDGLDGELLDRARQQGWMPNFERYLQQFETYPLTSSHPPRSAAEFWTTVTTGAPPRRHGIHKFARTRVSWHDSRGWWSKGASWLFPRLLPLETTPLSSSQRRVPTVAEIVAAKRYRVVTVNAWSSGPCSAWVHGADSHSTPAHDRDGAEAAGSTLYSLSDRGLRRALVTLTPQLEPEEVTPLALSKALQPMWEELATTAPAQRRMQADRLALRVLESACALAPQHEATRRPWDLLQVTLSGTDLQRLRLQSQRGSESLLEEYLRELDSFLVDAMNRVCENLGQHPIVVLTGNRVDPNHGNARAWIAFRGEPLQRSVGMQVDVEQVAPLLLALLGFPDSLEYSARVPTAMLKESFLESAPLTAVNSWGQQQRGNPSGSWHNEEQHLETLRSLGYIGGSR